MSISGIFIRRPVMTTLVMVGILIFGVMAYRALPVSDLPNVDYPDDQGQREPARARARRRWPSAVATPLEKQFSTIAGIDNMTSHERAGLDADHAAVQRSTATSTPPRRTCRRRSRSRCASCRPDMPTPPSYQKVNPADHADPLPRADLADAAAVAARRVRRDDAGAAASRRSAGVAQVQVYGAQKYAVRVQLDPARARRRAASASTRWPTRDRRAATSTCRPACSTGPTQRATRVQANGQLTDAPSYRPLDRRVSQRRAGAARRARAACSTACRTTRPRAGSTDRAASCSRCSGSRARTPSRSRDAVRELLPTLRGAAAGVGRARHPLRPRRSRSATRCTT